MLFEEFKELGVEIHITGDNGYGHLDEIKILMLGLFASTERQKILGRYVGCHQAAAEEGLSVNLAPVRYARTRRKGILSVDPERRG